MDWSSTFAGIEQPNEAYAPVLKRNIAYEQTKKPRRLRIDDSQAPAATEGEYESIEPVHEYEECCLREKQVVQIMLTLTDRFPHLFLSHTFVYHSGKFSPVHIFTICMTTEPSQQKFSWV